MKFGTRKGDVPTLEPAQVESSARRAEIVCRRNHVVGVVTHDDRLVFGGVPQPLAASHVIRAWCKKCPRQDSDLDVDPDLIRQRLRANPRRNRLRIKADEVTRQIG